MLSVVQMIKSLENGHAKCSAVVEQNRVRPLKKIKENPHFGNCWENYRVT
jgi:hypothetical protein